MNHVRNVKDINSEIPFLFKLDPGYNDTTWAGQHLEDEARALLVAGGLNKYEFSGGQFDNNTKCLGISPTIPTSKFIPKNVS